MFFLSRFAKKFAKPVDTVTQETMDRLMSYPWPGNIREVQNIIERAVVLSQGSSLRLGPDLLPAEGPDTSPREEEGPGHGAPGAVRGAKGEPSLPRPIASGPSSLEEVERHHILEILDRTGGVIEGARGAAKILNLHPNTLRSRMKKLGIRRPSHEIS
jgi:formate hydrogenlyase transcriptional activator